MGYRGTSEHFDGREFPELRDPVVNGAGPTPVHDIADRWQSTSSALWDINFEVGETMKQAAAAQEGQAADALQRHLSPLGTYAEVARAQVDAAQVATRTQASDYLQAKRAMPEPVGKPTLVDAAGGPGGAPGPLMPDPASEYKHKLDQYNAAKAEAARVMNTYQSMANENIGTLPQFKTPPGGPNDGGSAATQQVNPAGRTTTDPSIAGGGATATGPAASSGPAGGAAVPAVGAPQQPSANYSAGSYPAGATGGPAGSAGSPAAAGPAGNPGGSYPGTGRSGSIYSGPGPSGSGYPGAGQYPTGGAPNTRPSGYPSPPAGQAPQRPDGSVPGSTRPSGTSGETGTRPGGGYPGGPGGPGTGRGGDRGRTGGDPRRAGGYGGSGDYGSDRGGSSGDGRTGSRAGGYGSGRYGSGSARSGSGAYSARDYRAAGGTGGYGAGSGYRAGGYSTTGGYPGSGGYSASGSGAGSAGGSGAGRDGQLGPGNRSGAAKLAADEAAARGARGAPVGNPAGGRGAMGGMPMGAGRGSRSEDAEHHRPSWLVETSDIFGAGGQSVAPPVIGADPLPDDEDS